MKLPYDYIRREDSPSGIGVQLANNGIGEVNIFVTSACCGSSLNRRPKNSWACLKCSTIATRSGNGSRISLMDLHWLSSDFLRDWISDWTGIPKENIVVKIDH